MKILVPVKRGIDPYVKVRVKADGSGVEDNKMSINPFDEIAVEQAVQLKEQGIATEIVALSIGESAVTETIRHALALGADKGIHIQTENAYDALNIAKLLAAIVERDGYDLVIMGKQAIDNDNNQTGQMLAGILNWPQHTFASTLSIDGEQVTVEREIDGGLETLSSKLPAVVTTDLRLNEPRYASLPNIMKAKRKPIENLSVSDLNLELDSHCEILSYQSPAARQAGEMLDNVDALLQCLKEKDKVIGESV